MKIFQQVSWQERFEIALKEELTLNDIMKLRGIGKSRASELREQVLDYCLRNEITLPSAQIPSELVFIITGKDLSYYVDKMRLEQQALQLCKG